MLSRFLTLLFVGSLAPVCHHLLPIFHILRLSFAEAPLKEFTVETIVLVFLADFSKKRLPCLLLRSPLCAPLQNFAHAVTLSPLALRKKLLVVYAVGNEPSHGGKENLAAQAVAQYCRFSLGIAHQSDEILQQRIRIFLPWFIFSPCHAPAGNFSRFHKNLEHLEISGQIHCLTTGSLILPVFVGMQKISHKASLCLDG